MTKYVAIILTAQTEGDVGYIYNDAYDGSYFEEDFVPGIVEHDRICWVLDRWR